MVTSSVLIIDDHSDVRRMLRAGIETLSRDIKVIDVPSGEEATLVISREPIDLLVSDIRLPGISGLELYKRARMSNPGMRFILITGLEDSRIRLEVAQAGAQAYFYKPIEMQAFLDAVQRCLDRSTLAQREEIPPEEQVHLLPTLAERLADLHQKVEAICTVLLDDDGRVITRVGDFPESIDEDALFSYSMSLFSAAVKIPLLINQSAPGGLMWFQGIDCNIYFSLVGPSKGLLLAVNTSRERDSYQGHLATSILSATREISSILGRLEMQPEAPLDVMISSLVQLPELETPVEEPLPDIDELFIQFEHKELNQNEVDAFWDELISEQTNQVSGVDAISFDEARKLGLAPED
jgi:FixJ family two-component response regulator